MAAGSQVADRKSAFVIESSDSRVAIERIRRIGLLTGVVSSRSDDGFFEIRLARVSALFSRRDSLKRYGSGNAGVGRKRQISAGDIATIDDNAARCCGHPALFIGASA